MISINEDISSLSLGDILSNNKSGKFIKFYIFSIMQDMWE